MAERVAGTLLGEGEPLPPHFAVGHRAPGDSLWPISQS
jgi:hypothetical protein